MKQLNVRIEENLYDKLKKYSKSNYFFKNSLQNVVTKAIQEYLKNHKK